MINAGWRQVALHHLVRFGGGRDYSEVVDPQGSVPVIGSGGPFTLASDHLYNGESVLFGRKGTIDKPYYVNGKFWAVDTMYYTILGSQVHGRWLYYWAKTVPYGLYSTSTALPSMTSAVLGRLKVNLPSLSVQHAIADYLDRETAKIDLLIDKQEALIRRLRERREATVWMLALGQDEQPPFRNNWWGSPPEHWAIDKLGRHSHVVNGSTPSRSAPSFWKNGTLPWLNSSYANFDVVREADQYVTEEAIEKCHLPWLKPGTVLVGITGQGKTRGMAALLDMETTINQHLAGVVPDMSCWDPRYLTHLLRAAYSELRFISEEAGSTRSALTCAALHDFRVPRPPVAEQRKLAEHIDSETDKMDTVIAKAERFIELAKERRAALITAAVTGQIDVTAKEAA